VQGTSTTSAAKDNGKDTHSVKDKAPHSSIDVGKISNLVTTDLRNVTNMADFLLLLFYMPVTIVFCVAFLYIVLGWRCVFVLLLLFHSAIVPSLPSYPDRVLKRCLRLF
jgi:ABC-type multidrug transport system fused ATPase/permease subunit